MLESAEDTETNRGESTSTRRAFFGAAVEERPIDLRPLPFASSSLSGVFELVAAEPVRRYVTERPWGSNSGSDFVRNPPSVAATGNWNWKFRFRAQNLKDR